MPIGSKCPDRTNERDNAIYESYKEYVGSEEKVLEAMWTAKKGYPLEIDPETGKNSKIYDALINLTGEDYDAKKHVAQYELLKFFGKGKSKVKAYEDFADNYIYDKDNFIQKLNNIGDIFEMSSEGIMRSSINSKGLQNRLNSAKIPFISFKETDKGFVFIFQGKEINPRELKNKKKFLFSKKDNEFSSFEMMDLDVDVKSSERILKEKFLKGDKTRTQEENTQSYYKERLKEQLNYLYSKLKSARRLKDKKSSAKLETLIKDREDLLDELVNNGIENSIVSIGKKQLELVSKTLNKENITSEELSELLYIIKLYKNITDTESNFAILQDEDLEPEVYFDEELQKEVESLPNFTLQLQDLESTAKNLEKRVYKAVKKEVATIAEKLLGEEYTEKNLFENTADIGAIAAEVLDASRLGIPILDTMHALSANAKTISDKEATHNLEVNFNAFEKFKKSNFYRTHGFDLFLEKDENGKTLPNLTSEYTSSYWGKWKEAMSQIYSGNKNAFKKGQNWFKDNHIYIEYFETEEGKQAQLEQLKLIMSDYRAEKIIEEAAENFKDFRDAEIKIKEYLNQEHNNNSLLVDMHLQDWAEQHDPRKVIPRLKSGKQATKLVDPSKFIKTDFTYVSYVAKQEHHDKNFDKISQDDVALEYFSHIKTKIRELYDVYPPDLLDKNDIIPNSLPVLEKHFVERMKGQGLSGVAAYTGDFFKKAISVNKRFEVQSGRQNPETGETSQSLRAYMLSDRNIAPKDRSLDIHEILNSFIVVTSAYKFASAVETPLLMIRESITTMRESIKTPSNLNVKYSKGNEVELLNGLKRIKAVADFNIDNFYGNGKKDTGVSSKKILNKEEKIKQKELDAKSKELELRSENIENLKDEEIDAILKEQQDLNYEYEKLGVNLAISESVRSLMRYVSLKNLGWNPNSMAVEGFYGMVANFQHAVGGEDFNMKEMMQGFKTVIFGLNPANTKAHKKYSKFIQYFDIVGELHEMNQNVNNSRIKKGWKKLGPFSMLKFADKFYKGVASLAALERVKIIGKDGTVVKLYDAFDENMELLENFATKENINNWVVNLSEEDVFKPNKLINTINKITQMNKMITGNYDPKSALKISSTIYGEAAQQFRKWMFEGWAQRVQNEKYDPYLKRKVKGRWKSYGDIITNEGETVTAGVVDLLKRVVNGLIFNHKSAYKGLNNAEIYGEYTTANMKKNINGIRISLFLSLMLYGLKQMGDDDEKDAILYNYFMNQGFRLQSDIDFYSSPSAAKDILGNIVAVSRVADDVKKLTDAIWKSLVQDDHVFQQGNYKNKNRVAVRTLEMIPLTNSVLKSWKQGQGIFGQNK